MDIEKLLAALTLEEKAGLCSGKDFWHTKEVERLDVPSIMMSDGPHGLRKQDGDADHMGINESIKAVCFPSSGALASSFDVDLIEQVGNTLGNECQAERLPLLLGPGVNIKRSPLCGRNFEYFSEDPYLSGKMGAAIVRGIQAQGASASLKHFAANNQETLRMSSNSVVDERTLFEIYLASFEIVVKEAQPRSVMCAYNQVNGEFCAENNFLLNEVLRERWGFEGFVVTDWGAVQNPVKGVAAGLDLVMPGGNDTYAKQLVNAVQSGELSIEALDTAVRNILKMIKWAVENQQEGLVFDREADYTIAAEVAKDCAVLLKNNASLLPLNKAAKVAFIGEFAETPRYQGSGSSHINSFKVSNALEAAADLNVIYAKGFQATDIQTDEVLLVKAVEAAKQAEVAVIFAGLPDEFETEGADRTNLDLPANQNALIKAVTAVQPNTVVVLHNGSPVVMPWIEDVSAILEMYLAGDGVGDATVSLLFGDAAPSGKLAETFPKKLSDNPSFLNFPGENGRVEYREGVFVGYRYYDKKEIEPLFPFGHGLTYTEFAYSDLKLDKTELVDTEVLSVTCKITNIGNRFGKEAVQLYVADQKSTVMRPLRELKSFTKVALAPGETKEITFKLDKRAFAYYNTKIHDFTVETGEFSIEVGSSSRNIHLSATVNVTSTDIIPVVFNLNSTVGEIMNNPKGQAIMTAMRSRMDQSASEGHVDSLGAGTSVMVQKMMEEMPLSALRSFAGLSDEMINGLLAQLNS